MVNIINYFIESFTDGKGFISQESNLFTTIIIILLLMYANIDTNTLIIIIAVYIFYQKYITDKKSKTIKSHKKKKYKEILNHRDSGQLVKIFDKIYKFKKYNKKAYNAGKTHYNRFLLYIKDGDRGNENLKHVYDLACSELNESLNNFISITISLPAVAGYKKGKQVSNLELDGQLEGACKELYMYSVDLCEHLLNEIRKEWDTNKSIKSAYVDKADLVLPNPSNVGDILYDNKFSVYNL